MFYMCLFQGGVVSHDQHLIQVWLCKDHTVYRLEGGLEQYKSDIESEFRMNNWCFISIFIFLIQIINCLNIYIIARL